MGFRHFDATEVFLGFLTRGQGFQGMPTKYYNQTVVVPSAYGNIPTSIQNLTKFGFTGVKSTMVLWGLWCWLDLQEGIVNLARSATLDWEIDTSNFSNKTSRQKSLLAEWQTHLGYRAPGTPSTSGIAPALAQSALQPVNKSVLFFNDPYSDTLLINDTDYRTLALNYLYASGEAQRIAYGVAASESSRATAFSFYHVGGIITQQQYIITYLPAILVIGLVSLLAAAAMPVGMAVYTGKTDSARIFRDVNLIRLLVDATGLYEEVKPMADAQIPNQELENWADGYLAKYEKRTSNGLVTIQLQPGAERERSVNTVQ
jgi:hypothetical protein